MAVESVPPDMKCSLSLFSNHICGYYPVYKQNNCVKKLEECDKDISRHLQELRLCVGHQTMHEPAVVSEGELIALTCGIFRFDQEMTVCPYHRYSLGINWKGSKKCTFPLHVGKQQPQKGVTPLMSKTILNKFGCLQPVGSGFCNGCKIKCKDLIPNTPKENEYYNEHKTFTHVLDSAKQDWFSVTSLLENVLVTMKEQLPLITEIKLRSDNAGCYHCGHMWLCLPEIIKQTGIQIKYYCYS